jgi:hypothetical protein
MALWYPLSRVDVVRNVSLTPRGTFSVISDKLSNSDSAANSANYADLGTLATPGSTSTLSVLTIATPIGGTTRNSLFNTATSGSASGLSLSTGYNTPDNCFTYNSSAFTAEAVTNFFVANSRAVYGLSYNAGSITEYKNGVAKQTVSDGSSVTANWGVGPYCVGGRYSVGDGTVYPWIGTIEFQALFFTVLSAAEFTQISANPWGELLEPLRRRIYFGAAAAAAGKARVFGTVIG